MATTTAVSSNTSATGNLAAYGQKIISALGTGSGIDVQSLASNLVQAEQAPQQALIQKKLMLQTQIFPDMVHCCPGYPHCNRHLRSCRTVQR